MGKYYNPADDIPLLGRRLSADSFGQLTTELQPGEVLMGYYKDDGLGSFAAALYLSDDARMRQFIEQYGSLGGQSEYYAVPKTILPNLTFR